jgi:hypothetical protein
MKYNYPVEVWWIHDFLHEAIHILQYRGIIERVNADMDNFRKMFTEVYKDSPIKDYMFALDERENQLDDLLVEKYLYEIDPELSLLYLRHKLDRMCQRRDELKKKLEENLDAISYIMERMIIPNYLIYRTLEHYHGVSIGNFDEANSFLPKKVKKSLQDLWEYILSLDMSNVSAEEMLRLQQAITQVTLDYYLGLPRKKLLKFVLKYSS